MSAATSRRPSKSRAVAGATGSGKTTTLHAMLNALGPRSGRIATLEDPVEYQIPLIRQSNIRHDIGLDFASGIKAILRQDPDVILDLEGLHRHRSFSSLLPNRFD